ncbi:glucokinase [Sulfuricystis multivorans]|uniref:glucokinase n=1 Tax=Sulfuricystis multivorans TaxID=2211108 RepID=UPI000F82829D|nr:glucokinase [Sulfuricystis multivorans]
MKLIGDIGGTKTLLALVDDAGRSNARCRFASAEFATFDDLLAAYLREVNTPIDGGCLAVAGPVANDGRSAKVTNLPWQIDCALLEARFGLGRVRLINDFAAVAHGIAALKSEQMIFLQAGEPCQEGVKLVLGAGTGLGMAIIAGGRILPSEGGHIGFAPLDETQWQTWRALQARYGRVTAERVISGPGMENLHRILAGEELDAAAILARARQNEPAALRTLEVFCTAYGAFAGDMALAVLAHGGVFLAGGVTQHLLPELGSSGFVAAFNDKAEHAELVRRIPVAVVTDPDIGLQGAAAALQSGAFR